MIDRVRDRLLGSHVVRRSEHQTVGGQTALRVGAGAAVAEDRDAEVDDARHLDTVRVLLDDDVLGLEVAVDEARFVCVVQALEHLPRHVDDARPGHRCFAEHAREIRPVREVHHHVAQAVRCLADVDDPDDVRVSQATGELGLALEALRDLRVFEELRVQHLHREGATDLHVRCFVDRAHRAFAEAHLDPIAVREDLADDLVFPALLGRGSAITGAVRHQNLPLKLAMPPPSVIGAMTSCDSFPDVANNTTVATAPPIATR